MKITSKRGGTWEISADSIRPAGMHWEAIHSDYVPDGDAPRFHERAHAATLEELYVECEVLDQDWLEERKPSCVYCSGTSAEVEQHVCERTPEGR